MGLTALVAARHIAAARTNVNATGLGHSLLVVPWDLTAIDASERTETVQSTTLLTLAGDCLNRLLQASRQLMLELLLRARGQDGER